MNTKKWATLCGVMSLLGLFSTTTFAASIDPPTFEASIGVGETIMVDKKITLDEEGATKLDVFFLSDNTGSMGSIIATAKAGASDILNAPAFSGLDIAWGVGRYLGDPSEGVAPATAYQLQQAINPSTALAQTAIDAWFAVGGGDAPEANFFALSEVATEGAATSQVTGWRAGAQRIAVWFGDAPSHTATINQADTIADLVAEGVTVVAFNSGNAAAGIDQSGQASAVTAATGGSLTNNMLGLSTTDFVDAVVAAISGATTMIDLIFQTSGDTSGLDVSFACTDALGCDDVPGGAMRTFQMTITGLVAGIYEFEVFARGVDAIEMDRITVRGAAVPEPSTVALLGLGLLGLGLRRMRRQA